MSWTVVNYNTAYFNSSFEQLSWFFIKLKRSKISFEFTQMYSFVWLTFEKDNRENYSKIALIIKIEPKFNQLNMDTVLHWWVFFVTLIKAECVD